MGSYIPSTREERLSMLESIGLHSFDELYSDIPEDLRLKDSLSLPSGLSELEVARKIEEITFDEMLERLDTAGWPIVKAEFDKQYNAWLESVE